jgi:hypothetical protein
MHGRINGSFKLAPQQLEFFAIKRLKLEEGTLKQVTNDRPYATEPQVWATVQKQNSEARQRGCGLPDDAWSLKSESALTRVETAQLCSTSLSNDQTEHRKWTISNDCCERHGAKKCRTLNKMKRRSGAFSARFETRSPDLTLLERSRRSSGNKGHCDAESHEKLTPWAVVARHSCNSMRSTTLRDQARLDASCTQWLLMAELKASSKGTPRQKAQK